MTKIKIQIKNRFTGSILFEYEKENNTIKETVLEAVKSGANLRSADLRSADLSSANLRSADLSSADLRSADLSSANLRSADLRSADLYGANLYGADLSSADLYGANLRSADLRSANLRSADLRSADLYGAKHNFFYILLNAVPEIDNLRKSIVEGKIDGSTYEGECACLCGTIEKSTDKNISKRIHDLRDAGSPIESLFVAIKKGDTPETNQVSKIVLEWLDEFTSLISVHETL